MQRSTPVQTATGREVRVPVLLAAKFRIDFLGIPATASPARAFAGSICRQKPGAGVRVSDENGPRLLIRVLFLRIGSQGHRLIKSRQPDVTQVVKRLLKTTAALVGHTAFLNLRLRSWHQQDHHLRLFSGYRVCDTEVETSSA